MPRRIKQDHSPEIAEATAAFLVVGYLAVKYGPANWGVVILCVLGSSVTAAIIFVFWKRHVRSHHGAAPAAGGKEPPGAKTGHGITAPPAS
jgi:hypothetical protein